ncbi:MAG: hydrogenase expression/formation protein HypE, partial [Anaerovorax sp.]
PKEQSERALALIKGTTYGKKGAIIGKVTEKGEKGTVVQRTKMGGTRVIHVLYGEGLPRIC